MHVITTLGPRSADELGLILPHEHVFVDLRTWDKPGYAEAEAADVVALMAPEVERARTAGVTAIVDCGPVGVGRRADLLRAGFIKLSAGDDGITECEAKVLRAAARAGAATGATIGSHTIRGRVVRDQLDIIEAQGGDPRRFIWIHASADPDFALNVEMGRRGAWVEYDWIGSEETDQAFIDRIKGMLDAGLGDRLLLSHDRGWYDPAKPGGGTPKPFTYISERFLPRLSDAGVDDATIRMLTHDNPFRAFAR
jgi:phosphotriesterase-related protein